MYDVLRCVVRFRPSRVRCAESETRGCRAGTRQTYINCDALAAICYFSNTKKLVVSNIFFYS